MCFWIFHNWQKVKVFDYKFRPFYNPDSLIPFEFLKSAAYIGFECNKCKRRKIKQIVDPPVSESLEAALNWLSETPIYLKLT